MKKISLLTPALMGALLLSACAAPTADITPPDTETPVLAPQDDAMDDGAMMDGGSSSSIDGMSDSSSAMMDGAVNSSSSSSDAAVIH